MAGKVGNRLHIAERSKQFGGIKESGVCQEIEFQMFSEGPGMTRDGELKSGVLV